MKNLKNGVELTECLTFVWLAVCLTDKQIGCVVYVYTYGICKHTFSHTIYEIFYADS